VFEAMSLQVICLGSFGAGSVMKLAINAMILGMNQIVAEALTSGRSRRDKPFAGL
jgi:3-hydroxyisobutyrate dehydrogenase-like beta-hydroxyacid dehydrogenase